MRCLVVIPGRLGSKRFPNKPLAMVGGQSLFANVIDSALAADVGTVVAAVDSPQLAEIAAAKGVTALRPEGDFVCGSERVAAAYEMLGGGEELVINLQGDMPFFPADTLKLAIDYLGEADISTLASPLAAAEAAEPNKVKAAVEWGEAIRVEATRVERVKCGEARDFSRKPITASDGKYYLHHGIYCFRIGALRRFAALKQSPKEVAENLEQLRALEAKMRINVGIGERLNAVDSPKDLANLSPK